MNEKETRKLSLAMSSALDLSEDMATDGNIAAHAYNVAYRTSNDSLAGIEFGWVDQEESTSFLVGLVMEIDNLHLDGDLDEFEDQSHEIADSAVPIYNQERIAAAAQLHAEVSDIGLLDSSGSVSLAEFSGIALYEEALTILYALVEAVREVL